VPIPLTLLSLSNGLPRRAWERLRAEASGRYDGHCAYCGEHPNSLLVHEVWAYDDDPPELPGGSWRFPDPPPAAPFSRPGVQRLTDLVPACHRCHLVLHPNRARPDWIDGLLEHLCRVREIDRAQAVHEVRQAFATWHERSGRPWVQDLGAYAPLVPLGGLQRHRRRLYSCSDRNPHPVELALGER